MPTYQEALFEQCKTLDNNLTIISNGFLDFHDSNPYHPVKGMIGPPINEIIKLKHQDPQAFTDFFEAQPKYKKFIYAEDSVGYHGSYGRQLHLIQNLIQTTVAPSASMPATASIDTSKIVEQVSKDAHISKGKCTLS